MGSPQLELASLPHPKTAEGEMPPPYPRLRQVNSLDDEVTERRIAQEMCSEQPPQTYHQFVRRYLLGGDSSNEYDPFARECPVVNGSPHVILRDNIERPLRQAISKAGNVVVMGRIGSGKTTLINYGHSFVGEDSLVVKWAIAPNEVVPEEALFHLLPQMLARHIFSTYWDALCTSILPRHVRPQISSDWPLLSTLKWFHTYYLTDKSIIPPGLTSETWSGILKPPTEWRSDILETLLDLITCQENKPENRAAEDASSQIEPQARLRKMLVDHLSLDDMRTLLFDLRLDHENFSGHDSSSVLAMSIIQTCQRLGKEPKLLMWLRENRPTQTWPDPRSVIAEHAETCGISFGQVWVFVDGIDKLAPSTQTRLVQEAIALSGACAKYHLHFVITASDADDVRAQVNAINTSPNLESFDLNGDRQWTESQLKDMLNQRLAMLGMGFPRLEERLSGFPLTRQAQLSFLPLITEGARRAYTQNDAVDAPIHALRLTRGFLTACAGYWAEHGFRHPLNKEHLQALVEIYWKRKPTERGSYMPTFQGREAELSLACSRNAPLLLNFYGEAGIGKTRLLAEVAARYHARSPKQIVAYVDLGKPDGEGLIDPSLRTLRVLAQAIGFEIPPTANAGKAISDDKLVLWLHTCHPEPVLMFDTTETVHTDTHFWEWLEEHLVRPLLAGGYVRLIFAGRAPAPWRDYDVRRQNQPYRLSPLSTQDGLEERGTAHKLIREMLQQSDQGLTEVEIQTLIELILAFSCGHPGLSKLLARWMIEPGARRWPTADPNQLRMQMAAEPVKRFIDDVLFEKVEPDWRLILRWSSILNWFDTTVLRQYLEALVAAGAIVLRRAFFDDWNSVFLQSIDRLRLQDAAVMWGKDGYRLYGVTRDIVRQYLKVSDPTSFRQASRCAGDVTHALAWEFAPDEDGFVRYTQEAEAYFQQAREEVLA